MGGAVSTGEDNDDLIDNLKEADYIKSSIVEKVFRAVDRGNYYLPDQRDSAYKDLAWRHDRLHLSAPCIYSEVMEALQLESGLSFLNLGSGLGYLSTMVGLILGPYGVNHGVEQYPDVVEYAMERLAEFKRNSSAFDEFEFCEPKFIVANCLQLNSGCQLYDRVYVGAACPPEHENYMKNLLKIGGILVMPLNDRLIQAKRVSETEWDIINKLPVSFATLVSPSPDTPPDLIDLPEPDKPTLQEMCRTTVRRVLRTNIHLRHPDLSKVKKRKKKPKRKSPKGALSNLNIVPLSMGMMILQQQFDRNSGSEDSLDGEIDDNDREVEQEDDHDISASSAYDVDMVEKEEGLDKSDNEEGKEGQFSTDEESVGDCKDVASKNGLDKTESVKVETSVLVPVKEDIHESDDDKLSGYASGESDHENEQDNDTDAVIDQVDKANKTAACDTSNGQRRSKMEEMIAGIVASSSRFERDLKSTTPPDANWSDTDSDGDDHKKYNIEEFLKCDVRERQPTKQRYSSTTSVDTSTTSGIGSFVEDHLEAEMGKSDNEKVSPGYSTCEPENTGIKKLKCQNMDIEEDEEEDTDETVDNEGDQVTLSKYLIEDIDSLTLPTALKSYLKYYRE
ncbi:PCMD1-like protein [Mya arenaria]|uniref:PCMD1-like protein n=1 Tax=Mya arenaria TaxID=6604 RepID=A0ABY7FRZ1_MYAAR|nr:protein-L-isoaspartate O-methyltransferase domain-containing protein 1-like [Mya arenaria]XP_052776542.1 protein-L-isoaspartate O-methyltransferase domain-containing protein 1-like [Mya arenaria]WAR23656.1 PCMD1-like protein [Mya arenaria]